jgi:hypothetical protein
MNIFSVASASEKHLLPNDEMAGFWLQSAHFCTFSSLRKRILAVGIMVALLLAKCSLFRRFGT